jgi:UPF0716 protein FxsA
LDPVLLLLFLVVPVVELYVIVQVSQGIGFLNTLGLLVLFSVAGAWLVKHQGRAVWQRFMQQVQAGAVPTREIADGFCILLGGALLLTPGFVTDAVGLLFVFPPTRAILRRTLLWRIESTRTVGTVRVIRATYGGRVHDTTARDDAVSGPQRTGRAPSADSPHPGAPSPELDPPHDTAT